MFEAHFQTFEDPEAGVALTARLSAFREELARRKLTGFVIPRADQQQNEYVAALGRTAGVADRVHRIGRNGDRAGATGRDIRRRPLHPAGCKAGRSQGLEHRAAGRSAARELARPGILPPATASDLIHGCTLRRQPSGWPRPAPNAGAELVAVDGNPLDSIWTERPPPPLAPVAVHGTQFSGEAAAEKLGRIRLEIATPRRRRAGAFGFARGGVDLQHPRRRRRRIRRCRCPMRWCRRTAVPPSSSITASCRTAPATIWNRSADVGEPEALTLNSPGWRGAALRSRSTARPPPMR